MLLDDQIKISVTTKENEQETVCVVFAHKKDTKLEKDTAVTRALFLKRRVKHTLFFLLPRSEK